MIYKTKPKNFSPEFTVVSCFVDYQDKILLLHRQDYKPEGNTWGVPAGKMNGEESLKVAILREIFEETGLELKEKDISHIKEVFIKYKDYDFVYHIFNTKVNKEPKVKINNKEHKAYKWIKPKEALKMDLIEDLDACIKLFYK